MLEITYRWKSAVKPSWEVNRPHMLWGEKKKTKKNKRNVGSFTRRESFKITRHYYYFHAWTVIYSRRVALLLAVYTDDAAPGVFNEDEEGWKDDGSAPLIIMIVSTLLYTKYIAERERERDAKLNHFHIQIFFLPCQESGVPVNQL